MWKHSFNALRFALAAFLLFAAALKARYLMSAPADASGGLLTDWILPAAVAFEVFLALGLSVRPTAASAAWVAAWVFAGVGVSSVLQTVVYGSSVTCRCLGAWVMRVNWAWVLQGAIVMVSALIAAMGSERMERSRRAVRVAGDIDAEGT